MPSLPLRPCSQPGCGALSTSRNCGRHPVKDMRPSSSQRGYGAVWRRLAARVMAEEPTCRSCGSTAPGHADHILARKDGGTDDRANLQRLCASCHSRKTARHDGGYGNTKYRNNFRATQTMPNESCQRA